MERLAQRISIPKRASLVRRMDFARIEIIIDYAIMKVKHMWKWCWCMHQTSIPTDFNLDPNTAPNYDQFHDYFWLLGKQMLIAYH